jgi:peptide/nickel transport system ATP-binding protein
VSIQAAIVQVLHDLRQEGLTLLFITHNLALVNAIADRVLVLEAGEMREYGPTAQVIGQPTHRYTQALLAAAPDLAAEHRLAVEAVSLDE